MTKRETVLAAILAATAGVASAIPHLALATDAGTVAMTGSRLAVCSPDRAPRGVALPLAEVPPGRFATVRGPSDRPPFEAP